MSKGENINLNVNLNLYEADNSAYPLDFLVLHKYCQEQWAAATSGLMTALLSQDGWASRNVMKIAKFCKL